MRAHYVTVMQTPVTDVLYVYQKGQVCGYSYVSIIIPRQIFLIHARPKVV